MKSAKLIQFPEGRFTELEWVNRFADRVESYTLDYTSLFDRQKFNRLDGTGQAQYEASLKRKAAKPAYRAWRGDVYYTIGKETFESCTISLKACH